MTNRTQGAATQARARPAEPVASILDPLIGRDDEVAAIERLIAAHRLVTLTGIGGSGKTRLAREICRRRLDRSAAFVDLSPLTDPALVPDLVAHAIGLAERPDEPAEPRVIAALVDRDLVLALDNAEHLLAIRTFLERLLAGTRRLRVLVTSRVPLGLHGEAERAVSGLAVTVEEAVGTERTVPAVALFLARAADVGRSFETPGALSTIAALCARLDGLPLAIELAARRTRILAPSVILQRLSDGHAILADATRSGRQSSVEAVIEWSVDLLSREERRCFASFGTFAGGFDAAAAAAVAGDVEVLPVLDRLVEIGLLRASSDESQVRFVLLETLRSAALCELAAGGELDAARRAHGAHFAAVAQSAYAAQFGPQRGAWLTTLALEIDNLRAALEWAAIGGDSALALRLAADLLPLWLYRGHVREGRAQLVALLVRHPEPDGERAHALATLARLEYEMNGSARAMMLAEEALGAARADGTPALVTEALLSVALAASVVDAARASEAAAEARRLAVDRGDRSSATRATGVLALQHASEGRRAVAEHLLLEVISEAAATGDRFSEGMAAANLSAVLEYMGRPDEARSFAHHAVDRLRGQDEGGYLAYAVAGAADFEAALGNVREAWHLAREAGERIAASESREMVPSFIEITATLLARVGQTVEAAQLAGTAAAAREAMGVPMMADHAAWTRTFLSAPLGPERFALETEIGRTRDLDEAFDWCRRRLAAEPETPVLAGPYETLTRRERDVLGLLAEGRSDGEIAEHLFISPKTASVHVANIKGKLGTDSRVQTVLAARALVL